MEEKLIAKPEIKNPCVNDLGRPTYPVTDEQIEAMVDNYGTIRNAANHCRRIIADTLKFAPKNPCCDVLHIRMHECLDMLVEAIPKSPE